MIVGCIYKHPCVSVDESSIQSIQSKLNHYQKYFSENMKNTRRIWKGINNLIGNRKANPKEISIKINEELTSDPYTVSQHFNDYFVSIANRIILKEKSKAFFLFLTN